MIPLFLYLFISPSVPFSSIYFGLCSYSSCIWGATATSRRSGPWSHWSECFGGPLVQLPAPQFRPSIDHLNPTRPGAPYPPRCFTRTHINTQSRMVAQFINQLSRLFLPDICQPLELLAGPSLSLIVSFSPLFSCRRCLMLSFKKRGKKKYFFLVLRRSETLPRKRQNSAYWWSTSRKSNDPVSWDYYVSLFCARVYTITERIPVDKGFCTFNDVRTSFVFSLLLLDLNRFSNGRSDQDEERFASAGSRALDAGPEFEAALTADGLLHHVRRVGDHSGVPGNCHVDPVQSASLHYRTTGSLPSWISSLFYTIAINQHLFVIFLCDYSCTPWEAWSGAIPTRIRYPISRLHHRWPWPPIPWATTTGPFNPLIIDLFAPT